MDEEVPSDTKGNQPTVHPLAQFRSPYPTRKGSDDATKKRWLHRPKLYSPERIAHHRDQGLVQYADKEPPCCPEKVVGAISSLAAADPLGLEITSKLGHLSRGETEPRERGDLFLAHLPLPFDSGQLDCDLDDRKRFTTADKLAGDGNGGRAE
jgi:hypothetical protein